MNKYAKLFFHRIVADLKQKELLPLKLLFFMHSSTILVLYPYLTIHMRELGISVEETAIMSAVSPVVAILMPPLAGMVGDKIGNFRVMLAGFSCVGGLSALLLLAVPIGRITITYPDQVIFGLSCVPESQPVLTLNQNYPCTPLSEKDYIETNLELKSCGFACHAILSENYTKTVLHSKSYDINMLDMTKNSSITYTYTLDGLDVSDENSISETINHQKLKHNENYLSSVRKLSKNSFYFPAVALYNFSCNSLENETAQCLVGERIEMDTEQRLNFPSKVHIAFREISHEDFEENKRTSELNYITSNNQTLNTTCKLSQNSKKNIVTITIPVGNSESKVSHLDLGSCSKTCIATSPRKEVCSNSKIVIERDMQLTFWSYLFVRVFVGIISGTSFALFEGAVIAILREHKGDYGLQRIYATIGGMISSPISGMLIDFASRGKAYTDFRPIFFLYAGLKVFSGILMLFINLEFKKAALSVVSDVLNVLKKVELIALFVSCLILGCAWGFIESFLFWLLEDLGGSKSLMGLTITVGGILGIPLLVLSGPIVKRIGHANVIFIGFVFYSIRLLGYSLIYNPWLCLIFEAMESITFGLSFTAAVTYAARLSTVTTDTSIQGLLGGLYYGVGKGVGSLIGGYLIKPIGIRHTFQLFSVVTIVIGLIYFIFYHTYMKQRPSEGTDINKKDKPVKEKQAEVADLKSKIELPAYTHYEDSLCNPGYEPSEDDEADNKRFEKTNGQPPQV